MWGRLRTAYKSAPGETIPSSGLCGTCTSVRCAQAHTLRHAHTHSLSHVSAKTTMTIVQETKMRRTGQKGNLYFLPLKSLLRAEGNRIQILSRVCSVISSALQVMITQPDSPATKKNKNKKPEHFHLNSGKP